jgi:hypothetical protein
LRQLHRQQMAWFKRSAGNTDAGFTAIEATHFTMDIAAIVIIGVVIVATMDIISHATRFQ